MITSAATVQDAATLQAIARETFLEAFASSNTEADMQHYLATNFSLRRVTSELENPDTQFFIAWEGQTPVGYLKLNGGPAQTELQEQTSLEIERIYVRASYHGRKVGQLLQEKALEVARLQGKSSLWLGVWEGNARAIRFYEKNGFERFGEHVFMLGQDEQLDIMMRKTLD